MRTIEFNNEYVPSAPVLPVSIAIPGESPVGNQTALVDTGADGTFVPTALLEELDLPISYMTNVRSYLGDVLHRVSVHKVDVVLFRSIRLPGIEVVGDDWGNRIILGRNVLNLLHLHLNGPAQMVGLQE